MTGRGLRIVLYGHSGCPGTARARAYLATHGLPYVLRDIFDSDAAAEFRSLGAIATPAITLGGRLVMVGFDQAAFEAALTKTCSPGGAGPGS